ncbi:MAG: hypothetical protein QOI63_143 [Thermoplasmata archaeon]|nr:hypothetical protein [Thermoplasmata archaeon]
MPQTPTPTASPQIAPDFSNYRWVPGQWRGDAASISTGPDGRLYLGVKGRDRKTRSNHYISIEVSRDALKQLQAHAEAALKGELVPRAAA